MISTLKNQEEANIMKKNTKKVVLIIKFGFLAFIT